MFESHRAIRPPSFTNAIRTSRFGTRSNMPLARSVSAALADLPLVTGSGLPVFGSIPLKAFVADSFFALWGHRHPVLYRRIPVQIAVLNDLADFEKSRIIGRRWPCLVCLTHATL